MGGPTERASSSRSTKKLLGHGHGSFTDIGISPDVCPVAQPVDEGRGLRADLSGQISPAVETAVLRIPRILAARVALAVVPRNHPILITDLDELVLVRFTLERESVR